MKVLVIGWLAGGAFIVLLSAWPQSVAQPVEPARVTDTSPAVAQQPAIAGDVIVPVAGVDAGALRDNFLQPRAGGSRVHHALDIMAPRGTPVIAAVPGTIRKLYTSAGGGLTVYEFDRAEERVYSYAHLDSYANGISEGLVVEQGTVIGYVGSTGNAAANAPHLHFAIELLPPTKSWSRGIPVNPYPILTARASARR
jgi:murein DD-endopeptidase MepM/ murein hydrolase activator NlpD